ncbi:ABC transporter permease [Pseudoruegeria sp. SK021]|uniref:ABC transporter permease n=1 Tax=Pseudoruegeria sp. SK021 TaxID=1933035 RepID=UPI000A253A12|nr:ABC transporter permease [Pseudoruegeria sp. SK021]OSP54811.1 ABC transporter permease [Pseudoruegeria sp. SK021]
MRKSRAAYPVGWRIMDGLEWAVDRLWPRTLSRLTPWLMVLPAILLVGLLVLGLIQIADASLRTLDRSTFLMSDSWSDANYARALSDPVYAKILWRSLSGAVIVTAITLFFAFPYAYLMVRTPRAWLRKLLLIALFLPFFIGQVVRAYGWLIILGNQGIVNDMLGLVGVAPLRLLYNYPAVVFGLVQYMLPFAVLMLAPALTAIPEETEAAAGSLGANWGRTLVHVLLPMARPGLVGAGLVVMTLTLTDFAMPAILGGGSQDFIANAIYDQFFRTSDQGLGSALALMLVGLGSLIVGAIFMLFGAGTLAMGGRSK